MTEADIVARLRRAWARPASLPEDELRVLISRAIEEVEMLRVLCDARKVRGVWGHSASPLDANHGEKE